MAQAPWIGKKHAKHLYQKLCPVKRRVDQVQVVVEEERQDPRHEQLHALRRRTVRMSRENSRRRNIQRRPRPRQRHWPMRDVRKPGPSQWPWSRHQRLVARRRARARAADDRRHGPSAADARKPRASCREQNAEQQALNNHGWGGKSVRHIQGSRFQIMASWLLCHCIGAIFLRCSECAKFGHSTHAGLYIFTSRIAF